MTESAKHGGHENPWGGMLDGAAVGLGLGMLSLLTTIKSPAALYAHNPGTILEMFPFIVGAVIVGAVAGYAWGRARGY